MKHKLLTKILATATILSAGGVILPTISSCNKPNYDNLFFTITNEAQNLQITFCDRGASIYSLKFKDKDGVWQNLVYHPQDIATFINPNSESYFHGKTLGRVTGRFADGKLNFKGKEYQLQINEKNTKAGTELYHNNCLHGGYDSFCFRDFSRYVSETDDSNIVAYNYFSPAMEAGFPEAIDTWIVYTMSKTKAVLNTTIVAVPTGETVIDITTHPLFRLGNDGDVKNHKLFINTKHLVEYDDHGGQVPTGNFKDVTVSEAGKTPWDFQTNGGKTIGQDVETAAQKDTMCNGYDHIWKFNDIATTPFEVTLQNLDNHIKLAVTTNDTVTDGVICYSNCYPKEGWIMQDGSKDTQYAGITIEPYTYFDANNLAPITYTPDNPFYRNFTYTITQE